MVDAIGALLRAGALTDVPDDQGFIPEPFLGRFLSAQERLDQALQRSDSDLMP